MQMNADDAPLKQEAGALMESLLTSLLDDFDHWFQRGEQLLENCPRLRGESRRSAGIP